MLYCYNNPWSKLEQLFALENLRRQPKNVEGKMDNYEVLKTDVLVIGGGGAGVRAAIEADNYGVATIRD